MAEENRKIFCPSCGRKGRWRPEYVGKRVKCACGHVIVVPSLEYEVSQDEFDPAPLPRPPVELPRGPEGAVSPELPIPFKKPPRVEEPDGVKIKRLLLIGGVALALIAIGVGVVAVMQSKTKSRTNDPDAAVLDMIQNQYGKEIHEWFAQDPNRVVQGMIPSQAIGYADRWKQMGAKQVMAFGARMTTSLAIELPDDPAKRREIFDWQKQWHEEAHERVISDTGQRWLLIRMKP